MRQGRTTQWSKDNCSQNSYTHLPDLTGRHRELLDHFFDKPCITYRDIALFVTQASLSIQAPRPFEFTSALCEVLAYIQTVRLFPSLEPSNYAPVSQSFAHGLGASS